MKIGTLRDLRRNGSLKFQANFDGREIEGFAIWHSGEVRVFENQCQHLPLPLDYDDNQFFAPDGESLVCQTHGAVYDPLTGRCSEGPCRGNALKRIPVEIRGRTIFLGESG